MPVHLVFHDPSGVDDFHFHVNEHSVDYIVTVRRWGVDARHY
jgi:hypothetical protein